MIKYNMNGTDYVKVTGRCIEEGVIGSEVVATFAIEDDGNTLVWLVIDGNHVAPSENIALINAVAQANGIAW